MRRMSKIDFGGLDLRRKIGPGENLVVLVPNGTCDDSFRKSMAEMYIIRLKDL
jgi:hypothetical protein